MRKDELWLWQRPWKTPEIKFDFSKVSDWSYSLTGVFPGFCLLISNNHFNNFILFMAASNFEK